MAKNSIPRPKGINPSKQSSILCLNYSNFKQVKRGKEYVWEGDVQPTPLSRHYTVRISYRYRRRPQVDVIDPPLIKRPDQDKIPHVFSGDKPCLHMSGEWLFTQFISQTIIPWISLWLFYYEIWLATGEWLGGGHEPEREEDSK